MKLKLNKKDNNWNASIHKGNGGISSLIIARTSRRFFNVVQIFLNPKNYIKAL